MRRHLRNAGSQDGGVRGAVARAVRVLILDVGPLRRRRDYRIVYVGGGISLFGSMITFVALPYQVYRMTHSSLAVGLLGAAELGPLIAGGLIGGVLADGCDRRRTAIGADAGMLVVSGWLAVAASGHHPPLALLFVAAAIGSGLAGLRRPSVDAMVPTLVDRSELPAVSALAGLQGTIAQIAGPAAGGLLIATVGLAGAYALDAATLVVSVLALIALTQRARSATSPSPGRQGLNEGFSYLRARPDLVGTYVVDLNAMIFGMPTALFPALAVHLHGGAGALGLLYAAPALGAMAVSVASGWVPRIHRHGLAILWSAAGWGMAIIAFGLAPTLLPALVFLGVAGAADMVSGLFRMTVWNRTVPDEFRGRIAGVEMLSYTTGPALGNVEAGAVASIAGLSFSVVSGGALCVVGTAVIAWALPALRRYDDRRTAPSSAVPDPAPL